MSSSTEKQKKAVLFCTCSGACASMAKLDFWSLAERVRLELEDEIEFLALHPRLCEPDGERFMGHVLSKDILFITPACNETKQKKLLRDGFDNAGVPMDEAHWIPVSMGMEDNESVFQKIKAAVGA
ncbi:hypothetical protein [Chrysiogenes arsenatis]|uniref:hypothetical protein n=1 Tax=Chrysiogenes arsenatis TaxID=309797 RepID=UPI000403C473|nr:hypothetical protein [Chrysiogenes arsenatis]